MTYTEISFSVWSPILSSDFFPGLTVWTRWLYCRIHLESCMSHGDCARCISGVSCLLFHLLIFVLHSKTPRQRKTLLVIIMITILIQESNIKTRSKKKKNSIGNTEQQTFKIMKTLKKTLKYGSTFLFFQEWQLGSFVTALCLRTFFLQGQK